MNLTEMIQAKSETALSPAERVANAASNTDTWRKWLAAAALHPDLSALGVLSLSEFMAANPDIDCNTLFEAHAVTSRRGTISEDTSFIIDGDESSFRRLYIASTAGVDKGCLARPVTKVNPTLAESVSAFERAVNTEKLASNKDDIASWIIGARYGLIGPTDALPAAPVGTVNDIQAALSSALAYAAKDMRAIDKVWPEKRVDQRLKPAKQEQSAKRTRKSFPKEMPPKAAEEPKKEKAKPDYTETSKATLESIRQDLEKAEKAHRKVIGFPKARG